MKNATPALPRPEFLHGASRDQLLDLLDALDELRDRGLPVPETYLHAVSGELMRAEACLLERLEGRALPSPGLPGRESAHVRRWPDLLRALLHQGRGGRCATASTDALRGRRLAWHRA